MLLMETHLDGYFSAIYVPAVGDSTWHCRLSANQSSWESTAMTDRGNSNVAVGCCSEWVGDLIMCINVTMVYRGG